MIGTFREGETVLVRWHGEACLGKVEASEGSGSMRVLLSTGRRIRVTTQLYDSEFMADGDGRLCQIGRINR